MKERNVIIVGGGLAGLSAAYELSKEKRLNILLIEKETHLGGRVQTCKVMGHEIDVGGFIIYPWYKRYHQLIKDLGLDKELTKIPDLSAYYNISNNPHGKHHEEIALSYMDILKVLIEIFPKPLTDSDSTDPRLDAYDDLTIESYVRALNLPSNKTDYYLSVFDTFLQGYCYGSVAEHKMAFMASTLFQSVLQGDVHSASYFRNGSKIFIDALSGELQKNGVKIRIDCKLKNNDRRKLITSQGKMFADDVIFCQRPSSVNYTKFITATVSYDGVAQIEGDADWGSCFYKENARQQWPILSIVNLATLYGQKLNGHFNLNIKVNHSNRQPVNSSELLEKIQAQLQERFQGITIEELVNRVDWEGAMPISREDFIASLKNRQGEHSIYFAGDFMGCPSMETALMNGKRAAEQLIDNL